MQKTMNNLTKLGLGLACAVTVISGAMCSRPEPEPEPVVIEPVAEPEPVELTLTLGQRLNLEYADALTVAREQAIAARNVFPECRETEIFLSARTEAQESNKLIAEVLLDKLRFIRDQNKEIIDGKVAYSFTAEGNDDFEDAATDVAAIVSLLDKLANLEPDDSESDIGLKLACEIGINEYWAAVGTLAESGTALLRENRQVPIHLTTPVEDVAKADEVESDETE
jgi:hypothetical protein